MKTYKYNQILCCSSEKSIITGQSGFGVRAKSPGISADDADEIYMKCGLRYTVPMDEMITAESLRESPQLDQRYPHVYLFRDVTLNDGRTRYVVARVMYAGADYGFFINKNYGNRVGSNYIAHAFVFDELPPMRVVSEILRQKKFMPANTLCSSDNEEFMRILTGEPFDLTDGEIDTDVPPVATYSTVTRLVMTAMLQSAANKLAGKDPKNIIAKIGTYSIERAIEEMGAMPVQLTDGFFFNANVPDQASVPEGLRLIMVNEKDKSETLDEYHIVIDARGDNPTSRNVDKNFLLSKILELPETATTSLINAVAALHMNTSGTPGVDLQKSYQLAALSSTDLMPELSDLTTTDYRLLESLPMPNEAKEKVWSKINAVVKESFTGKPVPDAPEGSMKLNLRSLQTGIDVIALIRESAPHRLENTELFGNILHSVIFKNGSLLWRLIDGDHKRLSTIMELLKQSTKPLPPEDIFYEALCTTSDLEVWRRFLPYYYHNEVASNMSAIVDRMMQTDYKALALAIFPVSENLNGWLAIIHVRPEYASVVRKDITDQLCMKIRRNPQNVMKEVVKLNPEALSQLDLPRFANTYAEALLSSGAIDFHATSEMRDTLSSRGVSSQNLDNILAVHGEADIKNPTDTVIKLAMRLKVSREYIMKLFADWVKLGASKEKIGEFINSYATSPDTAALLLDTVWLNAPYDNERTIVWLFGNIKSSYYKSSEVPDLLRSLEAQKVLKKENTFFKKMMRKFFMILVLCICTASMLFMQSCKDRKDYAPVTPFYSELYGDSIGTYKSESHEFDNNGNLLKSELRTYAPDGKVLSIEREEDGKQHATVFTYDETWELLSVGDTDREYWDLSYSDKNHLYLLRQQDHGDLSSVRHYYDYNFYGKLEEESLKSSNSEDISKTSYEYDDHRRLISSNEITGKYRYERLYDPETGNLTAANTYSFPKDKLKKSRNYTYAAPTAYNDSVMLQEVIVTDGNGKSVGHINRYTISYATINAINAFKAKEARKAMPRGWLLWVVLGLTGLCGGMYFRKAMLKGWFKPFKGLPNANGMRRLWMFNYAPYTDVALTLTLLLGAFVTAVALLMGVGAVTYAVLWIVKVIFIIIVWIGWICLIGGILAVLSGAIPYGLVAGVIGGVIVYYEDNLRSAGESLVNWGFDFMNRINVFDWCYNLFVEHWDIMLLCFAVPLGIFLAGALAVMVLVMLLTGFEWTVMKIYGVRRPCPVCGSKGDKEYWADKMHKHPVKLQPGVYGVFSHVEPATGTKMPTMLLNGKGKLMRRCPSCGSFINAGDETSYGTEKHIGVVGHRSSGKSYLTYSLLDKMKTKYGSSVNQIDVDRDTKIESNVARIAGGEGIQTNVKDAYRAIQLILKQSKRPVPYHLFFYDVAGEKFNQKSAASKTAMDFYRNVNQIVFIIDPTSIDYAYNLPSPKMEEWLESNASPEKYSVDGTFSTLKSILESTGRSSKNIDLVFVVVKADMGYLDYCGYSKDSAPEQVKAFMQSELGLGNLVNAARGTFKSVDYAVASVKNDYDLQMSQLMSRLLTNVGIQ